MQKIAFIENEKCKNRLISNYKDSPKQLMTFLFGFVHSLLANPHICRLSLAILRTKLTASNYFENWDYFGTDQSLENEVCLFAKYHANLRNGRFRDLAVKYMNIWMFFRFSKINCFQKFLKIKNTYVESRLNRKLAIIYVQYVIIFCSQSLRNIRIFLMYVQAWEYWNVKSSIVSIEI